MKRFESLLPGLFRTNRWAAVLLVVTALLGGVAASVGGAAASPAPQAPDPRTRPKIDSHYHFRNQPGFIEDTVKLARRYNAKFCLISPYEKLDAARAAIGTYPDIFIGFGVIKLDDPEVFEKIDAYHKAGFKGVGEITKPLKNFHDPSYYLIYERLQDLQLNVLFHTGIVNWQGTHVEHSGMDRMRPAYLDIIARRFPGLTIQGAHLGNPWYTEAAEVARWDPNLFFDVTGSSLLKKQDDPKFWGEVLWWRPSLSTIHSRSGAGHAFSKIVFGSDEGPEGFLANIERFDLFLRANDVPEEVQEQCWYGTKAKHLGLE